MKQTKVLRLNVKKQEPIVLGEEIIDDVDTFVNLGATVSTKRMYGTGNWSKTWQGKSGVQ